MLDIDNVDPEVIRQRGRRGSLPHLNELHDERDAEPPGSKKNNRKCCKHL